MADCPHLEKSLKNIVDERKQTFDAYIHQRNKDGLTDKSIKAKAMVSHLMFLDTTIKIYKDMVQNCYEKKFP